MITTWQRILVILIGIFFGLIVGYICIKPHLENTSNTTVQNINTNDVFKQYLNNNENNNNNNNISNENSTLDTNSEIENQNYTIEE